MEEEKPTLKSDLKKVGNIIKEMFRQPTKEEMKEKIEISKLKTELAEVETKRKEVNARRWDIGGKL
jgi:hypothetical protein